MTDTNMCSNFEGKWDISPPPHESFGLFLLKLQRTQADCLQETNYMTGWQGLKTSASLLQEMTKQDIQYYTQLRMKYTENRHLSIR